MSPFEVHCQRLKHVAVLVPGGTPKVDEPRYWTDDEDGVLWAAIADLTREPVVRATARRVTREGISAARLRIGEPGLLLFAMYASLGQLGRLDDYGCWNQAILGLRVIPRNDSRFVEYVLTALRPHLKSWARSNTQDNLNAEQVGNLPVPKRSHAAQKAVADFLDRECARIEVLIASLEVLFTESIEWQAALTRIGHEAVAAPMIGAAELSA